MDQPSRLCIQHFFILEINLYLFPRRHVFSYPESMGPGPATAYAKQEPTPITRADAPELRSLVGDEVGPLHAVFPGHSFLGGSREAIEKVPNADPLEPGLLKRFDHLCNLQSAGNSPGPEVNVVAYLLGQLGADDDVGELQPAAWPHHPE
jgi:hypothetical protein